MSAASARPAREGRAIERAQRLGRRRHGGCADNATPGRPRPGRARAAAASIVPESQSENVLSKIHAWTAFSCRQLPQTCRGPFWAARLPPPCPPLGRLPHLDPAGHNVPLLDGCLCIVLRQERASNEREPPPSHTLARRFCPQPTPPKCPNLIQYSTGRCRTQGKFHSSIPPSCSLLAWRGMAQAAGGRVERSAHLVPLHHALCRDPQRGHRAQHGLSLLRLRIGGGTPCCSAIL